MVKRMWLLGAVLLAGLFVPAVRAEEEEQRPPQPYVVLVGIDQYQDPQIKPRKHAEADAKALYDLFASKDYLGAGPANVKLLLGAPDPYSKEKRNSEPATRENILKALEWLEKNAKKDDLVVFAFLGEGAPLGERTVYFAADSTFKDRAKNAVASGDIETHVEKIASQKFVALIDVNFLGFDLGKENPPDLNQQNLFREYLANDDTKDVLPNRVVLLPNNGVKPSVELDKHGLFTQVVLDGLKGKADVEGYEPDGNVTINELIKYFSKQMHERAVELGKGDEEKGQLPAVLVEGHPGDFVVDHNPAVYPKAKARLSAFEKLAKEKELPDNLREEGANLLAKMPKLEAKQSLRKAYQKLADATIDVPVFQTERQNILDAAKLSERDATNFAIMVLRGAKLARQGYVKDVNQGTMIDYAVRGLYRAVSEPISSAVKEKLENVKAAKDADLVKLLADARQHLGKREDLANGKDITYSLNAMLTKLDKHTYYFDPESARRMDQDIRGNFSGIGVQIRKNIIKDQLQVVTPIIGSPAYKAGLTANDIITQIVREVDSNGKKLAKPETIPTKGLSTEDAVKKILGKEGTPIKLVVEREGAKEPITFSLIRGRVEVESVLGAKRNEDDSWNYVIDPENKICYVRLTQFSHNTYRDLEKVMRKLYKAGIKGFVLDLRFNPGGLLDSAVKISDLYIDDGLIVSIRPRNGPETSYVGKSDGSYATFPMVCLVNGASASASEIVSACLQDHGRAIIMGSRSYGKGSVQTIHPFDTGGRLKLTTATFWRPSGRNLNRASTSGKDEDEWGVTPDDGFTVKLSTKQLNDLQDHLRDAEIIRRHDQPTKANGKAEFHDRQLDMALDYLRAQIRTAAKAGTKKAGG
jgi:C-terminal peptidase prc